MNQVLKNRREQHSSHTRRQSCVFAGLILLTGLVSPAAISQTVSRVHDGFEVEIEHRMAVRGGGSILHIDNYMGDVELVGESGREVIVTEVVYVRARSEAEARELGMRAFSDVRHVDNRIEISGSFERGDGRTLHVVLVQGMQVNVETLSGDILITGGDGISEVSTGSGDVEISGVQAPVRVRSGAGDVEVSDIAGSVSAASGAGDVDVMDVSEDVDLVTGAGDIDISSIGGDVEAATGGGDIVVSGVQADVMISTAGGDIEAIEIQGNAELSTSGGSIEMHTIGGDVTATTLGGEIEGIAIGGTIAATTMAGDIDLRDVAREITVTTTVGDITVTVQDASFLRNEVIELRAQNGDIDLFLPRDTNADVRLDLGFEGEFDGNDLSRDLRWTDIVEDYRQGRIRRVDGRLNEGGGRIELRTDTGRIKVGAYRIRSR